MAEQLDLASPETFTDITGYRVVQLTLDTSVPFIKVTIESNTGARLVWSLHPPVGQLGGDTVGTPVAEIREGLSFVNQGKFQTLQNKSLERWLLEQMVAKGFKLGVVSGTPD